MNLDNYTIKSQEAINKAAELTTTNQQQHVEPRHLLKGIFQTDENVTNFLIKKLSINKEIIDAGLDKIIASYPKVSGQQTFLSNDTNQVLQKATTYLKEFKGEYVAVEHLLLAILRER